MQAGKGLEISMTARCDENLTKLGNSDNRVQDFKGRTKCKERTDCLSEMHRKSLCLRDQGTVV